MQAITLALALGGTLAVVTTAKENDLLLSVLSQDSLMTIRVPSAVIYGPWIGLTQAANNSQPAGG